jgi:hypothetical protein
VVHRRGELRKFFPKISHFSIVLFAVSLLYCEDTSAGSGVGGGAASDKGLLTGETRNGLQPCGQWPPVWVPVTAAP